MVCSFITKKWKHWSAACLGVLLTGCSSLLYHPTTAIHVPPKRFGLTPEDVWIPVASDRLIHGWYFHSIAPKTPKAVLVFFHGNAENLSSHYLALLWLLWNGYDFFIFDYEGYGQSPGKPSPEKTIEDGRAALDWVYGRNPKLPIGVFGQSLGGAVAMRAVIEDQGEHKVRLVLVESTFASYKAAARSVLSRNWLTWIFQPFAYLFMSDSAAPGEKVAEIAPIPLIVIHGDQDPVIDFSLGKEIFRLAGEPKEFWRIPNGGHIDALWRSDSTNVRRRFLQKLDQIFCIKPCKPGRLRYEPWISDQPKN